MNRHTGFSLLVILWLAWHQPVLAQTPLASPSPAPFPTLSDQFEKNFTITTPPGLSGRIAFTARIDDFDRLLVLDLDAKKIRKIVDGPGNNMYPSWSPNGKFLAFTSDRDDNKEIYLSDWSGQNQERLTENKVVDDNPSWTANGKGIIYYQDRGPVGMADSSLLIVSPFLKQSVVVSMMKGRNITPRMSLDGAAIAYSTNRSWPGWDICLWDVKLNKETCPLQGRLSFSRPSWANLGKELVYVVGVNEDLDLSTINLDTGERGALPHLEGREYDPVFSPNDKFIAFTAETDRPDLFNVYLYDRENKKTMPLLTSKYSIRYLSWSGETTLRLEAMRIRAIEEAKKMILGMPDVGNP